MRVLFVLNFHLHFVLVNKHFRFIAISLHCPQIFYFLDQYT